MIILILRRQYVSTIVVDARNEMATHFSAVVLTRLPVVRRRWLDLHRAQR